MIPTIELQMIVLMTKKARSIRQGLVGARTASPACRRLGARATSKGLWFQAPAVPVESDQFRGKFLNV